MEQIQPLETKICRDCGIEKQFTKFTKKFKSDVCNQCKAKKNGIKNERASIHRMIKNKPLQLIKPSIHDYERSYRLLQRMGYSLDQDIHEQFCNIHNLNIRSPKQIFKNNLSPKDLGLV